MGDERKTASEDERQEARRKAAGEQRSFDPSVDAPTPRQSAGAGGPPASTTDGWLGPGGDPVEGKRDAPP